MDNTLLVSLSQQLASFRSMEVIANNLANADTPAFKRESAMFQEYVEQVTPAEGETGSQQISFVKDAGTARDLNQGHVSVTNAPFDFAINGKGYFTVQTASGPRYTRNGHFTMDASGRLVTSDGDPLQGDGGDITIAPEDGDIHVAADGTVSGLKGQIGKIKLVQFDDEAALVNQGASLYSTDQQPKDVEKPVIQQGAIEASNVSPVIEISHMIQVMRAYQATANLTQSQEDMLRNAIDKLAGTQS
ncbi:MAG TPA: flagellar basal-body rod protein FlgF [Rhizomicrobium sp.]|nr:flagellar basal-body rod protein FlgF [Rhizomicrobium sp.]